MAPIHKVHDLLRRRTSQFAVLTALLTFVVWRALSLKLAVRDLDNWWHISVGEWILENHSFPHNGIFSRTAANRPWAAYSWGYEVILAQFYKWFDIVGVGLFGAILTVAVAFSVYLMTRRLSGRFWPAVIVATVSASIFLFGTCPRPMFGSMILFTLVLSQILEANRTGSIRPLYWVPLIFVFWANFHIQFIYGLAAVGLLFGASVLRKLAPPSLEQRMENICTSTFAMEKVALVLVACVIATLVNPYSYHLYEIVYSYANAKVPYKIIRELQALNFRFLVHYVQLLLTGAAFFALGRQKKVDLFKMGLLAFSAIVAFRTTRDAWLLGITAAACLAELSPSQTERERGEGALEYAGIAVFLVVAGFLLARVTDFNRNELDEVISSQFPVKAVNFLRQNPQPGPLYNTFDWGGFLIWYMPDHPVAIDGRTDLYGDELESQFMDVANGENDSYLTDRYLKEAGIVLLQKSAPLATGLGMDPRFKKIYEDRLAIIYVPR
jgi:hypothetical protein